MGILTNALVIGLGCLLGGKLRKRQTNYHTLGITIMIISLVGFIENVFNIDGARITSENLILVLFAFFLGSKLGDLLKLDQRLSYAGNTKSATLNAVIDATLYFGVGGLQISGPIALVLQGDNSQLYIKSLVDIPFALAFGATYGKAAGLSAIPVALVQIIIAVIVYFSASIFTTAMVMQLCAVGYIILFFSGFNLMTDGKHKINNVNMLPGILLVVLLGVLIQFAERIL